MQCYATQDIRNVVLVGPKGVGKTSLAEAILYHSKITTRLGKVLDGTSAVDYDSLEVAHKQSLTSKVFTLEWQNTKIHFLDTPGYADFLGEALAAIWACDSICLVIDATHPSHVSAQKFFKLATQYNKPIAFFINRLDAQRADWGKTVEWLKNLTNGHAVLFYQPEGEGVSFQGVKENHTEILETVAETDEKLMEKYLATGDLTQEELKNGLQLGATHRDFFPVFAGSATRNIGVNEFLNAIATYFPAPQDSKGPPAAQIFKITSDPGLGEIFYLRVVGGTLQPGMDLYNPNKNGVERVGHLFAMRGKERIEIPVAIAGDLVATAKLKQTAIGDTLCLKQDMKKLDPIPFPQPVVSLALKVASKQEQDKLGIGLQKLMAIDPTFKMHIDKEFGETVVEGMGEQHIEVVVERLKERFGVQATLGKPHIPYRETVTRKSEAQGKYKKQTGGHGQYGDCWLRIEPLPRGKGFEFASEIFGGSIPSKYVSSVEKGVREALNHGVLASYPVVDVKVVVYDGSYHDVDSSDLAFQIAASMAFKEVEKQAGPQLLEPIMNVEVTTPAQHVGDVTSDIASRRGRVQAMENSGDVDAIKAQVPLAELYKYSTSLRSLTSGAANYTMSFSHYEVVPPHLVAKIVEEARKEREAKPHH